MTTTYASARSLLGSVPVGTGARISDLNAALSGLWTLGAMLDGTAMASPTMPLSVVPERTLLPMLRRGWADVVGGNLVLTAAGANRMGGSLFTLGESIAVTWPPVEPLTRTTEAYHLGITLPERDELNYRCLLPRLAVPPIQGDPPVRLVPVLRAWASELGLAFQEADDEGDGE